MVSHLRPPVIDLRSDTVTRPGPAMRRAIAEADVGDDVLDGDPTVQRLEARVAELLGMEWALFVPTGTMGNQVAIAVNSRPGTEILVDDDAHIVTSEMGGAAALSFVQLRLITPAGAVMDAADVHRTIRPPSREVPPTSLLCIENTHNSAGGKVTDVPALEQLVAAARAHGLRVHLDGARLWNAAAATGRPLAAFTAQVDTVMVSFSKGLGAPVGGCVAGRGIPRQDAYVVRKRLGGGMRQSGIIAAGALYGLERNLTRLPEDHANARELATIVGGAGGARVVAPETNIVMIDLPPGMTADAVAATLAARGILVAAWHATRIRAVTHLDATADDVRRAAGTIRDVLTTRD